MFTTKLKNNKYDIIKKEDIKNFLLNNNDISAMYAVIQNNEIIHPFVGTIKDAQKEFPNADFIKVTPENGIFVVGERI